MYDRLMCERHALQHVESAKANALIPYDYPVKCMRVLAKTKPDIDALLPWNFEH